MTDQKKIEEALSRSVCGGWDRSFLESILQQRDKGRSLTAKQNQTLGKVLARNSKEAQAIHENWSNEYHDEYYAAAKVLAAYHTRHAYYRPMAADILSFEHFLTPGTLIIIDGRTANARFLKSNFQRNWDYSYAKDFDQHFFELLEEPLGIYNKRQIDICLGQSYYDRLKSL